MPRVTREHTPLHTGETPIEAVRLLHPAVLSELLVEM